MDERLIKLKEEVKKGSVSAALSLAEALKWGYYGDSDPHRAARMYRICAHARDKKIASIGFYNLGVLYYHGYLSPDGAIDARRAFACFLKSAMKSPNAKALSLLGDMYRYGQYVEKNEEIAVSLYGRAQVS